MAAPAFDPVIDFDGQWNTTLADRYLPLPGLPKARYECIDGRLFVTPTEAFSNTYGEGRLLRILGPAADAAGFYLAPTANLAFHPGKWLQPDLAILHTLPDNPEDDRWVPIGYCAMAVEFVSPGSAGRERIDKPGLYAAGGVPYLMRVEIARPVRHVSVVLHRLADGRYENLAGAMAGQVFEAAEPFPMRFAPEDLLY
jgi:Putative restriction endonuclease